MADLCDNIDLSRIKNPTEKDYQRIEKYRKAADRVLCALEDEGDREYINTERIDKNGCVSVPESCSEDEFADKFIDFVERNNWSFSGCIISDEQKFPCKILKKLGIMLL